jgi:predicted dienelactone hydrolase
VAFQTLKSALVTTPVLVLPDFSKPFEVEINASDLDLGAVLMQSNHPVAFVSKPIGPKLRDLSTILLAVEQWRSYL